jgi:hypothetical protein
MGKQTTRVRAAVLLTLLAWGRGAVAGELTCVFQMTRETTVEQAPKAATKATPTAGRPAPEEAKLRRTSETRRTVVGLAKDVVTVTQQGESSLVHHFPSKRTYVLDLREKSYADVSLFGTVAFRVNELAQRRAMGEGFAAAGVPNDPKVRDITDQFTAESLFSRRLPQDAGRPDAPTATAVQRGKEWEFTRNGRRFVRFVPSDRAIPAEYRRSWTRFLVIQCSIHPTIRERIVQTGVVPELLEFTYEDGISTGTVTYRLESVNEGPERWDGVPTGFTPKVVPGDRLGRILARLAPPRASANDTLRTQPEAERFVAEALARGSALDAYLGWSEYMALARDDTQSRPVKADLLAKILATKDQRVLSLRFKDGTREEAEAILKSIDGIDRSGLKKGYQLDVWRGFVVLGFGRVAEAHDSLLKALEANPYLLNNYRQLGEDHLRSFETVDAWRCFDAIRRVDPGSDLLTEVNELEARYEKEFPDDF